MVSEQSHAISHPERLLLARDSPAANEADNRWLRWRSSSVVELGREENVAESES
jgi:hypothetical protein